MIHCTLACALNEDIVVCEHFLKGTKRHHIGHIGNIYSKGLIRDIDKVLPMIKWWLAVLTAAT